MEGANCQIDRKAQNFRKDLNFNRDVCPKLTIKN